MEISQVLIGELPKTVDSLYGYMFALMVSLSSVGIISSALIEVLKAFRLRVYFNQKIFTDFVKNKDICKLIHHLTVGGNPFAFYTLKSDLMVARLKQVANDSIIYPSDNNRAVIFELAMHHSPECLCEVYKYQKQQLEEDWKTIMEPVDYEKIDQVRNQDIARERLSQLIESNLKGLEIRLTHHWELLLQGLAILVSTIIILTAVSLTKLALFPGLLVAILGGMVAPVAHDILAILKR